MKSLTVRRLGAGKGSINLAWPVCASQAVPYLNGGLHGRRHVATHLSLVNLDPSGPCSLKG